MRHSLAGSAKLATSKRMTMPTAIATAFTRLCLPLRTLRGSKSGAGAAEPMGYCIECKPIMLPSVSTISDMYPY